MTKVGVLLVAKAGRRARAATLAATLVVLAGLSLMLAAPAIAHVPDGYTHVDMFEGNENQEDAGDLYFLHDGDTVFVHWHVEEAFEGEVTDQFVCVGSYPMTPPDERCKPGQAPEGTVFWADPIGSDDWSFTFEGDATEFQLHLSIAGKTLLSVLADPDPETDGQTDGETDGETDGGTDGQTEGETDGDSEVLGEVHERAEVKGRLLAQTGSQFGALAWLGLAMLVAGVGMRFAPARQTSSK